MRASYVDVSTKHILASAQSILCMSSAATSLAMLCRGNVQAPSHFSTPTIGARLALLDGDMKIIFDSGAGEWSALPCIRCCPEGQALFQRTWASTLLQTVQTHACRRPQCSLL